MGRIAAVDCCTTNGTLNEIIAYRKDKTFNATENSRINSYLALKYGQTLGTNAQAQDYLASDGTTQYWTGNATYQNNIAGIVRDDASALLQVQSTSQNTGVQPTISLGTLATTNQTNASTIATDKNALVWGSNTLTTDFGTAYAFTGASIMNNRMNRFWKVQETGDVGTVKVYVKVSDIAPSITNLHLLASANDTFDNDDTKTAMTKVTINSIEYYTADVNLANGEFYTFGGLVTAPGGVVADLEVWLRADKNTNTTTDGTAVTSWLDQVGAYNATGVNSPLYRTGENSNTANFNPSIDFATGANRHFTLPSGFANYTAGMSNFSIHSFGNSVNWGRIFDFGIGEDNNNLILSRNDANSNYTISTRLGGTETFYNTGTNTITNNQFRLTGWFTNAGAAAATVASQFELNGSLIASLGSFKVANNVTRTSNRIGRSNWAADANFVGFQSEFINYKRKLDVTETTRVNSYLALKYGLTMTPGSASNYLASDGATQYWTGNATYQNNIAGIVRDDASALLQVQSTSQNTGVQPVISLGTLATTNQTNASTIATDKNALVWGSNTLTTDFGTAYAFTGASLMSNRMNRFWKVQETGEVGTVKVYLPASAVATNMTNVHLLVSANDTFDNADTKTNMTKVTINSIEYYTADVNLANGEFYTFGGLFTAPGGVVTDLVNWYSADVGTSTTTDGVNLAQWNNRVETTRNLTPIATLEPPFKSGENVKFNFNPAVWFQNNDVIGLSVPSTLPTGNAAGRKIDIMYVANNFNTAGFNGITAIGTINSSGNTFSLNYGSSTTSKLITSQNNATNDVSSVNSSQNTVPVVGFGSLTGPGSKSAINNLNFATNAVANPNLGSSLRIGEGGINGEFFEGQIAEVIYYSNNNNDQNLRQIATYLALKYGITLDAAFNYVSSQDGAITYWDATANATYHNNIAGIVRDDASTLLQKQSVSQNLGFQPILSAGTLAVNNQANATTITTDKNALVIGSNTASATFATSFDGYANSRMSRVWKVQETGDLGAVKIYFTAATKPGTIDNLNLIVSTDETFTYTDTFYAMTAETVNGVAYYVATVDLATGTFFTFVDKNFCTDVPNTAAKEVNSTVGISTYATLQTNWLENISSGHLVLESGTKGFVISRMTTAQRDAIAPANLVEGMLIYNTDANGVSNGSFQLYNGTTWNTILRSCNE